MKKLILSATFLIFSIFTNAQSPTFQWAKKMGGNNGSGEGSAITINTLQYVYATGNFNGKTDFDPGAGVSYLNSIGGDDIFISRSNSVGTLLWAKQLGGTSGDFGKAIAVDASGNVYTTGYFSGTADFDPGAGFFNLTSTGVEDIFVSKLDASGNFVWAKQLGGSSSDFGYSIAVDGSANVYITGTFSGTADFDPGVGAFNLIAAGNSDVFISKLNSSGNFVWAKQLGGTSPDYCYSIATDASANVYTTGYFMGTADFDPGAGTFNLIAAGGNDIFVSKLNTTGNFVWAKKFGGTSDDFGRSVTIDGSGNVYTTGYFSGTADFDPGAGITNFTSFGNTDIYISKLDATGNNLWAKQLGGTSFDYGYSIAVDGSANVYTTGAFVGTSDFDPGPNILNLTALGYNDIFISKLNTSGNFLWAKTTGGYDADFGFSIAVSSSGFIYYSGFFRGQADFDPGAGISYLDDPSGDIWPVFSKLDASGNFNWATSPGIYSEAFGRIIKVNSAGEVFTTGRFHGTVDFDPGAGVFNLTTDSSDHWGDIFIMKTDASGNFIWVKQIVGSSEDFASSLKVDASGNILITGTFRNTADFDPGIGTFNLTSMNGSPDIFILKLDASGSLIWAKKMGNSTGEYSNALTVDASGNVYITGAFSGTVDFDPGAGVFNLIAPFSNSIYIAKYDASGNFIWVKQIGGVSSSGFANAIALDGAGNIFTSGTFSSTIDFDPGIGAYNLTSAGGNDVFISKLDMTGNFVWAKQVGGTSSENSQAIGVDGSGNVYTAGNFVMTVDFDPGAGINNLTSAGNSDIFILKLNGSGNFVWTKQLGGTSADGVNSIAIDASANIYTTGTFNGTADFNPDLLTAFNLISLGGNDVFISKLNSSGNFVWAKQFGGTFNDYGNAIDTDVSGNIYTTGLFRGTIDFDPNAGIFNLSSTGYNDAFIHKMSQCPPPSATITASGPTGFCTGGSVTLNANTGAGLTFQWSKNGVSINGATSSSYVATTTGSYTCTLNNTCGAVTSNSIQVTLFTAVPATPGAITTTGGVVKVCPNESRTYTVTVVTGVTYTWIPCTGSVITNGQGTNSVTIQYNAGFPASDTLRVVATNSCGNSAQRKLKISRNNPGVPAAITGNNFGVCNLSGIPFSVTNVAGMTYAWSFNTGTATVASGQGTSSITTNYTAGFVSGSLSVTASNGCGTSAARVKTIYAKPTTPVSITGATSVCLNQQNVPYSIAPLANVTNYTWTGPTGSHISDGITTSAGATLITTATAVTVNFATTAGAVKVRGNNACASGSYKTLSIAIVCREGDFSNLISETHIYPNPASTNFTLETDDATPFDIEIYDALGRLILTEVNLNSGYRVDTNGLVDGLYSVVVRNGNNITTLKLVIQK